MSETNPVSPPRQRVIEDMAARKLDPHTQRSHLQLQAVRSLAQTLARPRRRPKMCAFSS